MENLIRDFRSGQEVLKIPIDASYILKRRRIGLSSRMSDRSLARSGGKNRMRFMGRGRLYLGKSATTYVQERVAMFLKDLDVGDVHLPTALGNSLRRPRRRPVQKDWAQWDAQRGAAQRVGRAAGLTFGVFHAPRVGRAVGHVLLRHGGSRAKAIGVGAVAAYGAAKGVQALGGYAGRKVDEAAARIFR